MENLNKIRQELRKKIDNIKVEDLEVVSFLLEGY